MAEERKRGGRSGGDLDDVQMMGIWNFTLQGDTPLYWIRSGALDRYLLKFRVHSKSPATYGIIIHAEADGNGTDGASFWAERRPPREGASGAGSEGSRRYLVAGEGITSKPIVTRAFPDPGGELVEDIEVLVEGYRGTILLQDRKVQLRFKTKQVKGCIAFFNTTQAEDDDIHFADVRITALRRGPIEVSGVLARRERSMLKMEEREQAAEEAAIASEMAEAGATAFASPKGGGFGHLDSRSTTQVPDSTSQRLTQSTVSFATANQTHSGGFGGAASTQRLPRAGGKHSGGASPQFGLTAGSGPLRKGASDGVLRKSAGNMFSPASTRGPGERWLPLATNAPSGEQQLLGSVASKRGVQSRNACNDFIRM